MLAGASTHGVNKDGFAAASIATAAHESSRRGLAGKQRHAARNPGADNSGLPVAAMSHLTEGASDGLRLISRCLLSAFSPWQCVIGRFS